MRVLLRMSACLYAYLPSLLSLAPSLSLSLSLFALGTRLACSQNLFDQYIDANALVAGMEREELTSSKVMTPKMFSYRIRAKCKAAVQHIVLPEVRAVPLAALPCHWLSLPAVARDARQTRHAPCVLHALDACARCCCMQSMHARDCPLRPRRALSRA